jgi:hypothetical protein
MSFFHSITLNPHFFANRAYLSWAIEGNPELYNFVVMKSFSPDGPWEFMGQIFGRTDLEDRNLDLRASRDQAFYKIYAQSDTGREESEIVSWKTHVDPRLFSAAQAMISQEMVANKVSGKAFVLFKRKLRGDVCKDCSFEGNGVSLVASSMCSTCYGTGIVEGYEDPVSAYGRWAQRSDGKIVQTGQEKKALRRHTLRAVPYPALVHGDLVVDTFSLDRYLVVEYTPFLFSDRIPIAADVLLHFLGRSDIRYSIPLPE